MLNDINVDAKARMNKSIKAFEDELGKIRAGRASAGLLDNIMVPYYGNNTPLSQVASVSVDGPLMLLVKTWEKGLVATVEKAIRSSDLGLNPASAGDVIRVPLPPLSEERRKELIKRVRTEAENAKVAVRNIRRDANSQFKDLLKDKEISEDEQRGAEDKVQKLTDQFVVKIDQMLEVKEKDLLDI